VRRILLVLLAASLVGCSQEVNVDQVPTIEVSGRTFVGSVPSGYVIPRSSLSVYGTATKIVDPGSVVGSTVLALDGVPPSAVVFMESRIAGVPFLMCFAADLPVGSDPDGLLIAVPELCNYYSRGCSPAST